MLSVCFLDTSSPNPDWVGKNHIQEDKVYHLVMKKKGRLDKRRKGIKEWTLKVEKNFICKNVKNKEYMICLKHLELFRKWWNRQPKRQSGARSCRAWCDSREFGSHYEFNSLFLKHLCSVRFQKVTIVAFWKLEGRELKLESTYQFSTIISTIQLRSNAHLD